MIIYFMTDFIEKGKPITTLDKGNRKTIAEIEKQILEQKPPHIIILESNQGIRNLYENIIAITLKKLDEGDYDPEVSHILPDTIPDNSLIITNDISELSIDNGNIHILHITGDFSKHIEAKKLIEA